MAKLLAHLATLAAVASLLALACGGSAPPPPKDDTGSELRKCGNDVCPEGTIGCNCLCGNASCVKVGTSCPALCTPR